VCDPANQLISPRFAARKKLREGIILLHYFLARRAQRGAVIRFARLLERQSETALDLPAPIRCWPALLRWFDPVGGQTALARHLQIAAMVVDSVPGERRSARANIVFQILWEILACPIRLVAGRIIR
jgi:hypothetical protein